MDPLGELERLDWPDDPALARWIDAHGATFAQRFAEARPARRLRIASLCLPPAAFAEVLRDLRPGLASASGRDPDLDDAIDQALGGFDAVQAAASTGTDDRAAFAALAESAVEDLDTAWFVAAALEDEASDALVAAHRATIERHLPAARLAEVLGIGRPPLPTADGPPDWSVRPNGALDEPGVRAFLRGVRANVERLRPLLTELGYRLRAAGDAHDPAALEARVGALPLALRVFFEEAAPVSVLGSAPRAWGRGADEQLDPLHVDSPGEMLGHLRVDPGGRTWLPLFPDSVLKAGRGGVGRAEVALPSTSTDPVLHFQGRPLRLVGGAPTTFCAYLRWSLGWAGLPGARLLGNDELARRLWGIAARLEPLTS